LKFQKSKPIEIETIEISNLMSEIPFDVVFEISKFLQKNEILKIRLVCKEWNNATCIQWNSKSFFLPNESYKYFEDNHKYLLGSDSSIEDWNIDNIQKAPTPFLFYYGIILGGVGLVEIKKTLHQFLRGRGSNIFGIEFSLYYATIMFGLGTFRCLKETPNYLLIKPLSKIFSLLPSFQNDVYPEEWILFDKTELGDKYCVEIILPENEDEFISSVVFKEMEIIEDYVDSIEIKMKKNFNTSIQWITDYF
jgi:hypothetical protein